MVAPNDPAPRPISPARRRANRLNAKKSTGPRTPDGKATAAKNSTSHGIFCRDLLLPGEDEKLFRNIRESVIERINPQDALELMFVDRIVQAQWRLNRCQAAEQAEHDRVAARMRKRAERDITRFHRRHGTRQELIDDPCPGDDELLRELDILEMLAEHDISDHPGITLNAAMHSPLDRALERLIGYEQKLERTMHRALLELRHLRGKEAAAWQNLPKSPYAGTMVFPDPPDDDEDEEVEAEQNDGALSGGTGIHACDVGAAHTDETVCAPEKNEPTAKNSPASPVPADSSNSGTGIPASDVAADTDRNSRAPELPGEEPMMNDPT